MPTLDFWYEFASTYSYPAAMRIEAAANAAGVDIRWRPFLLGPIFKAYGWTDLPFNIFAAKGRYMWRDLTRICEDADIPVATAAGALSAERAEGGEARACRGSGGMDACIFARRVRRELRRAKGHQR